MWEIPLAELNQLIHVHLYRAGKECRWRSGSDGRQELDDKFDSLCAKFGEMSKEGMNPGIRIA